MTTPPPLPPTAPAPITPPAPASAPAPLPAAPAPAPAPPAAPAPQQPTEVYSDQGFHFPDPLVTECYTFYGIQGAGKTTAYLDMALLSLQSGSDAKFYILDTDDAIPRMTGAGSRFEVLNPRNQESNLVVRRPYRWRDYAEIAKEFSQATNKGDFVVIDRCDEIYDVGKNDYMERIFEDVDKYIMDTAAEIAENREAKAEAKARGEKMKGTGKEFGGLSAEHWGWIKDRFNYWLNQMVYQNPAHTIYVVSAKKVNSQWDSEAEQELYARTGGLKPAGRDHVRHDPGTILFFQEQANGGYGVSKVKDRERQDAWDEKGLGGMYLDLSEGFARGYCMGIAGWEL